MVGTASCPLPPPKHRNVHQASTGHRGIVPRCSFRSCRGELEGGQGPGGVAGVVAAGGGDVAVAAGFQDGGAKVAQGGHDLAAVAGAGLGDVSPKATSRMWWRASMPAPEVAPGPG